MKEQLKRQVQKNLEVRMKSALRGAKMLSCHEIMGLTCEHREHYIKCMEVRSVEVDEEIKQAKQLIQFERQMTHNLRNELMSMHKRADDVDKRFDASVDNLVADRRRLRDGPAKHKHTEGDMRRMRGSMNQCKHH